MLAFVLLLSGGPVLQNYFRAAGSHTHFETINGVEHAVYSHVWEMENASNYYVYLQP